MLLKCFLKSSRRDHLCRCVVQGSVSARPHVSIPSSQFRAQQNRRDCKYFVNAGALLGLPQHIVQQLDLLVLFSPPFFMLCMSSDIET